MDRHFASAIALTRKARVTFHSVDIIALETQSTMAVRDALTVLQEAGSRFGVTIQADGQRLFDAALNLRDGQHLHIEITGVTSGNNRLILADLDALLTFQGGAMQARPPSDYYLLREDYASGEVPTTREIAGYVAIPAILTFLRDICDAELPIGPAGRLTFIVVAGKRISVPVEYSAEALGQGPSAELVTQAVEQVLSTPQRSEKRELFKRVLIRSLQDMEEPQRFSNVLTTFGQQLRSFEADRDLYLSEFAFEKLREQFERKRIDYLLKIDNAVTALVGKVLAIPIGQAVVVSQLSTEPERWFGNVALLLGSFFFTLIGVLVFYSHLLTLKDLERDALQEKEQAEKKYPALHARVKDSFEPVFKRARNARRIGWVAVFFLIAGFLVSVAGFDRVPPSPGLIRGWMEYALEVIDQFMTHWRH